VPRYTVLIEKSDSKYLAYCPDVPGCIATGPTREETLEKMEADLKLYIEGLKEEGVEVPEPVTTAVTIEVIL
jgi:predicted RNase H-like HicB family nuclease